MPLEDDLKVAVAHLQDDLDLARADGERQRVDEVRVARHAGRLDEVARILDHQDGVGRALQQGEIRLEGRADLLGVAGREERIDVEPEHPLGQDVEGRVGVVPLEGLEAHDEGREAHAARPDEKDRVGRLADQDREQLPQGLLPADEPEVAVPFEVGVAGDQAGQGQIPFEKSYADGLGAAGAGFASSPPVPLASPATANESWMSD